MCRNTITQSTIAYTVQLTLYNTVQSVTLRSGVIGDTPPTDNSNVIAYLFGPSNESPTGVRTNLFLTPRCLLINLCQIVC